MSEVNDGGPAFPCEGERLMQHGMSLRDYMAAAALQGLISGSLGGLREQPLETTAARVAYLFADAMLAERSKRAVGASSEACRTEEHDRK